MNVFSKRTREFRDAHRRAGLCLDCNKSPTTGKSRCSACIEKRRLNEQKRMAQAESLGYCAKCLSQPKLNVHRFCEDCYFKSIAFKRLGASKHWRAIQQKFQDQHGRCALSGVQLTLGVDAELDHIMPSSRKGSDNLDNVQWVLCVVNRMKDHMLESEFFGLIEKLYHTMKESQGEQA